MTEKNRNNNQMARIFKNIAKLKHPIGVKQNPNKTFKTNKKTTLSVNKKIKIQLIESTPKRLL